MELKKSKPESKGAVAQIKILNSAIKLFAEKGFEKTSIEMIAQDAGLSSTAPLYHFGSKEGILSNALDMSLIHLNTMISNSTTSMDTALQRLEKHFRTSIEWATKNSAEAQTLLYAFHLASFNKMWSEKYAEIMADNKNKIRELLYAGQREGIFTLPGTTTTVAELMHDLLMSSIIQTLCVQNREPAQTKATYAKWAIAFKQLLTVKLPN